MDFHKNVVGVPGLAVGQLLVEVPDLDDLPTIFLLLHESKESHPLPCLILYNYHS